MPLLNDPASGSAASVQANLEAHAQTADAHFALPALPDIAPTLLLAFAEARSLDPRVSFARASAGTWFDPAGILRTAAADEPRFDCDPLTGACRGLLVEEQRSNLLPYSNAFGDASWTRTRSSVTADVTGLAAPDGTQTFCKLVEDTSTNSHFIFRSAAYAAGSTYTLSVFAMAGERHRLRLQVNGQYAGSAAVANFDLSAGAAETQQCETARIEHIGGGVYRCSMTLAADAAASCTTAFMLLDASGANSYAGDGASGLYLWGAQLEEGAFPTSCIKTEASTMTRAADLTSVPTAAGAWYNTGEDQGTLVAVFDKMSETTAMIATLWNDGANRFVISQRADGASVAMTMVTGGVQRVNTDILSPVAPGAVHTVAACFQVNDCAACADGGAVAADSDTADKVVTGISALNIGFYTSSVPYAPGGHIAYLAYYPQRLPDARLQALTEA